MAEAREALGGAGRRWEALGDSEQTWQLLFSPSSIHSAQFQPLVGRYPDIQKTICIERISAGQLCAYTTTVTAV